MEEIKHTIELTELRSQNAALEKSITGSILAELAAEEALRYSESIVETVREPPLVLDADLKIISANRNFYRTFKATPGETIGCFIYDLGNQQWDIPRLRELLEEVLPEKEAFDDFEVDHSFRDIGHKIMRLNARQIYRKDIGAKMILLAIEDITEHKRLESLLIDSEEQYRRLFETASDGIVLLEKREGKITRANPATEKLLGYTEMDSIGNKLQDIGVLLDQSDFQTTMQNLNKSGILNYRNVKVATKSGQHIDTEIYLVDRAKLVQCNIRDITGRKQAEEEIKKNAKKYRDLFDFMPIPIYEMDLEGNITSANHAIYETFRGTEEDLKKGFKAWQLLSPEHTDISNANIQRLLKGEETVVTEYALMRLDGSVFPAIVISSVIYSNDKPVGFRGAIVDITERKQHEEELRRMNSFLNSIVENIPNMIFIKDAKELRFIRFNRAGEDLLGQLREDLLGKNDYDFFPKEQADFFTERDREVLRLKVLVDIPEEPLNTSNLGKRILHTTKVPILSANGEPEYLLGISTDITERKRAEEARKILAFRNEAILAAIPDIIMEVDCCKRYTWANPAGMRFFGEDVVGREASYYFSGKQDIYNALQSLFDGGENVIYVESWQRRLDGEKRLLSWWCRVLKDGQGIVTGALSTARDITEHRQLEEGKRILEERLQRAEKMEALGQLAGGVAHDLNNVLGILSGYSELLLEEIPEGSRSKGYVEKILQSTEKGAAIIQDLLTLARRGVSVSDVINLNNVVAGFLKTPVLEKLKDYHPRVTFIAECEKNLLNIKGSAIHLEKTLMNLMTNAAEAISGEGEVTIRTENRYLYTPIRGYDEVKQGDYAVLTVSDTGMGIPAENIEKIFEPFYTKKTMGRSGTGLGLAIVWGTVKDHNGYIDVQTAVGDGTTFTLYFPVTREALIAQEQKQPIERYRGNGESVLVVDDIVDQRDVAARLLTHLGYNVRMVSNGEEAVEYLKKNQVDILVLDMIMAPGIDGLETYERILEVNPKQKAILVSGFSETDRVKEAQKLGAGAYIKKPYVMEKIGVAIRDELNRK